MAKRNPKSQSRDRVKPIAEGYVEVKMTMTVEAFEKLKRAQSLEAQKNKSMKWGDVLHASLETYLDKNDPVRKADRAEKRKPTLDARVAKHKNFSGIYKRVP